MASNRSNGRFPWVHAVAVVVLIGLLVWAALAIAPHFTRERVESFVRGAGAWGPVILVGLQIAQILLAPIPGVFVPLLAGALYGPGLGVLITVAGSMIGSSMAYLIGKVAGMPLLKRWVGATKFEKARAIAGGRRWIGLVPILLFPFSPSDAICFAAGTIGMRPAHFYAAILLGRIPKDCAIALAGAGLIRLNGWGPFGK